MKRLLTILICLLSVSAMAQEPQIIGGYLLDGKDSFEELDAAVVTDAKRKDKNLDGKGMRFPGRAMMIPESVGKEIGSMVKVKDTFLVKSICFTVDEKGKGHFYGHPDKSAEMAEQILLRLKSDTATLENVVKLVRVHDDTFPSRAAGMRRFIGRLGLPTVQQLFEVKRADHAAQSTHEQAEKQAELRNAALLVEDLLNEPPAFTVKDLAINGRDLISLGIKPSPAMGELLATLLAEVQDETLQNSKEALLARVQQLVTP